MICFVIMVTSFHFLAGVVGDQSLVADLVSLCLATV